MLFTFLTNVRRFHLHRNSISTGRLTHNTKRLKYHWECEIRRRKEKKNFRFHVKNKWIQVTHDRLRIFDALKADAMFTLQRGKNFADGIVLELEKVIERFRLCRSWKASGLLLVTSTREITFTKGRTAWDLINVDICSKRFNQMIF